MDKNAILYKCSIAANEMRKDVLKMGLFAGSIGAHFGGGLSAIEILSVLYVGIMKNSPQYPLIEERDRFILSKGHAAIALYTALNQAGFISKDELWTFKTNQTILYGHPVMNSKQGIEFSTGSLGQGVSLGVGVALSLKLKGNAESRVFVLVGDGECDEGSIWEAAAAATHYRLNNLIVIVDKNKLQYDGPTQTVLSMDSLTEKWSSFGWGVIEIDGHNIEQLYSALLIKSDKPIAIIANTIKGKGVSFMENNPKWHSSRLSTAQYELAINELENSL